MNNDLFNANTPTGQCISRFHASLDDDRQARAELKRANTLTEIVLIPAYHAFLHTLSSALDEQTGGKYPAHSDRNRLRIAAITGLLAHTKSHVTLQDQHQHTIATQMAQPKKNSQGPCVSDLRFRRLIQEADISTLYPMLRRTLSLTGNAVDIHALAADIWFWSDRRRRQWAYDYYAKLQ